MSLPFFVVKQALRLLATSKREAFIDACKDPEKTQKELKDRIIRNSNIPFPEEVKTFRDFEGRTDLTKEKILFFETTSGSTGKKKEIPYTRSLLKSFENMFLLWAHDLVFHSALGLKSGKFFMSVSPQIGELNTDDRRYLSPFISTLLSPFLVSNPNGHKGKTPEEFFTKVSRDLLQHRDLEVISIWSPTYLLSLLDFMKKHRSDLGMEDSSLEEIWPALKLISCWTHAQASRSASHLADEFPNVRIQPKGLLSTEAPVTIPWSEANGCIPLVTETYLEFMEGEKLLGVHQLEFNKRYIVITSQNNGLLRYNTMDEVLVTGFYHKVPVLEFTGRKGHSSDLAGEKLSENLVRELFKDEKASFLIVPDDSGKIPTYIIFTECPELPWDQKLKEVHHYDLARKLGQLSEPKIVKVLNLPGLYLKFFQEQGMNLGDIKERILISDLTQAEKFRAWIDKELRSSH